jgi:GNAT superfamily N-acetyltransferase
MILANLAARVTQFTRITRSTPLANRSATHHLPKLPSNDAGVMFNTYATDGIVRHNQKKKKVRSEANMEEPARSSLCRIDRIENGDFEPFSRWLRGESTAPGQGNTSKVSETLGEYRFAAEFSEPWEQAQTETIGLAFQENGIWLAGADCTFYKGRFAVLSLRVEPGCERVAVEIVQDLLLHARTRKLELVQVILDEEDAQADADSSRVEGCLQQAGFRKLTKFRRLNLDLQTPCKLHQPAIDDSVSCGTLKFYSAEGKSMESLIDVTERTYRNTLDCPELDGVRSTLETLTGYRDGSMSKHREWWLGYLGKQSVGCIYLSLIGFDVWEITYMGVDPSFRSHGLGKKLLRYGIDRCRKNDAHHLSLAVDERNTSALNLYRTHGFEELGVMQAWYWHPRMQ